MAVKIVDVHITTSYSWEDIKQAKDWNAVKNTNPDWMQLHNTTIVNAPIKIEVEVVESTWSGIRRVYSSWQDIKDKFTNWLGIKNW